MKAITSAGNEQYKQLLNLVHSSRARRTAGLSVLDGIHLVSAFHDEGGRPELIAVSHSGMENPEIGSLMQLLTPKSTLLLSDALFRQLSSVDTPTGILAMIKTPRPDAALPVGEPCVLLENIQDPGNLGSILRSAAGAGIQHALLSKGTVHAWSPRVLRAGMGAHFKLQVHEPVDLAAFAGCFRGRLIATDHRAKTFVFEANLAGLIGLVFGNEGSGISPMLNGLAHERVSIPMPGKIESLNVAAAAAVCLFERVRQLHATSTS
jgi:RNA methyltransferase, TrmH family